MGLHGKEFVMNYIPSYKDNDCTEEEVGSSKPKRSKMTFNLSEETLLFLLRCAVDSADFNEREKGLYDEAVETRKMITSMVFKMNQKLGYEKYRFSNFSGDFYVEEVKKRQG